MTLLHVVSLTDIPKYAYDEAKSPIPGTLFKACFIVISRNNFVYQGLLLYGIITRELIKIFHSSFAIFELIGINKTTRVVFLETH